MTGTLEILEAAGRKAIIGDRADMRALYGRICPLDDGLPYISKTRLLSPEVLTLATP